MIRLQVSTADLQCGLLQARTLTTAGYCRRTAGPVLATAALQPPYIRGRCSAACSSTRSTSSGRVWI